MYQQPFGSSYFRCSLNFCFFIQPVEKGFDRLSDFRNGLREKVSCSFLPLFENFRFPFNLFMRSKHFNRIVLIKEREIAVTYTEIQDYPALTFLVRGIKFQGRVFVALDESNDTYKLFLMKEEGEEPQLVCETINCDQLGEIIDQYVESGDDEDEYQASLAKILEDLIM